MKFCNSILVGFSLLSIECFGQLSTDRNFVSKSDIKKPGVTNQGQVDALVSAKDRLQQVGYFDGLGRPLQSVNVKGSNGTNDIVAPIEYDNYGREIKKFLPYVDAGSSFGSLRSSAVTDQSYYYNVANGASDAPKDVNPFSQTLLEFSPLNRPNEVGATGQTWQPGTSRVIKQKFWLNSSADAVRIWNVTDGSLGSFGTYSTSGTYQPGELLKNVTEDEQQKQVIEFKDKGLRGREPKEISLKNLSKIIHARVVEIVEQVFAEIKAYGHEDPRKKLIAGIVLTGGGAELKHIKQLVEYITGMDTRIGYPNEHLAGNSDEEFSSPLYATAVGLVMN